MRKGEVQPEVELAAGSRLRQPVDSNIQFNNVQYEYENERWLNYVTPSVIRQQQRMLEQISAPRTLNTYQDYLEPLHVARPRLLEDEPPTYEVPPTYEECTLKPDWFSYTNIWVYFEVAQKISREILKVLPKGIPAEFSWTVHENWFSQSAAWIQYIEKEAAEAAHHHDLTKFYTNKLGKRIK